MGKKQVRDKRPKAGAQGTARPTIGSKRKSATCDELLSLLNQYIDGGVNPKICKALEGHLAGCNPCRVVVDNVRGTIRLYREDQPCDLPPKFRTQLHAAIRDCTCAKARKKR
jgi:hypothetical protein